MATSRQGGAVSARDPGAELIERMWHVWRLRNQELSRDPHEAWTAAYCVGAAEGVRYTARWAGLVPAIRDQVRMLEEVQGLMEYVEQVYAELFGEGQA